MESKDAVAFAIGKRLVENNANKAIDLACAREILKIGNVPEVVNGKVNDDALKVLSQSKSTKSDYGTAMLIGTAKAEEIKAMFK